MGHFVAVLEFWFQFIGHFFIFFLAVVESYWFMEAMSLFC
jgi:hypothetical protein